MHRAVLMTVTAVVLVVTGCTGLFQTEEQKDQDAIRGLIDRDSVWFSAGTEVDSAGTGGSCCDGDTWFVWWRGEQTHPDGNLVVEVTGDSAWVEWSWRNVGAIYTMAKPPDTTWLLWTKRVLETAAVRAVFRRDNGPATSADRGWRLGSVSLATGVSDSGNTVRIDSVRVQSTSNPDLLIVDPLNTFYDVTDLVAFSPGEIVTVTLYTNAEEARAFLHTFVLQWPFYVRAEFQHEGGGVFRGVWPAQVVPFPRFALFDLMHRNTIQREVWDYDYSGWLFPYQISEP